MRKEISFCHKVKLPIIGVVENMSSFLCPRCQVRLPRQPHGGCSGNAPPPFRDVESELKSSFADFVKIPTFTRKRAIFKSFFKMGFLPMILHPPQESSPF